jgi:aryl-alcohol dehydrogenase-like predicted oxidoreductase
MDDRNYVYGSAKISTIEPSSMYEFLVKIYASGIREIDTAPSYSDSELILGRYLHELPTIAINTKIGLDFNNEISPKYVRESLFRSLERLRLTKIHTLFLHSLPSSLVTDEIFATLQELKAERLCDAIAYSGDGINLQNLTLKSKYEFDSLMFTFNFLDQSNMKIIDQLEYKCHLYLKRVLANSVWRPRTSRDYLKELLGRSRGHEEYRRRFKVIFPDGLRNGYDASLDFVRNEYPYAKYVLGMSNLKQCEDFNHYIRMQSQPNLDLIRIMKQEYLRHDAEFEPVT